MTCKIAVLPGDGIGPETTAQAVKVLRAVAGRFDHTMDIDERPVGGAAYDLCGDCLPEDTLAACRESDAVLLGAVGGPKWDALPPRMRPEKRALLTLRSELGLYANLRPVKVYAPLAEASPLKSEIVLRGINLIVVRELTGGAYFGKKSRSSDGNAAYDAIPYSRSEIERVARKAFQAAKTRRGKVTSVDKANVLETSRLWRETVTEIQETEFPDVALEHLYVDNAAMQMIRAPDGFDVLLTENMFGDILSDEASQITGSIGLLPSASLGDGRFGLYEPIHGSAPDIAGCGIANPLATILSAALLLRHSFGLESEAACVERAVDVALADGVRTCDIARAGERAVSTSQMGDAVVRFVHEAR